MGRHDAITKTLHLEPRVLDNVTQKTIVLVCDSKQIKARKMRRLASFHGYGFCCTREWEQIEMYLHNPNHILIFSKELTSNEVE